MNLDFRLQLWAGQIYDLRLNFLNRISYVKVRHLKFSINDHRDLKVRSRKHLRFDVAEKSMFYYDLKSLYKGFKVMCLAKKSVNILFHLIS